MNVNSDMTKELEVHKLISTEAPKATLLESPILHAEEVVQPLAKASVQLSERASLKDAEVSPKESEVDLSLAEEAVQKKKEVSLHYECKISLGGES